MDMGFDVWHLTAAQRELLIPVVVPEVAPSGEVRKKNIRLLSMEEMQARTDKLLQAQAQGVSDGVAPS